LQTYIPELDDQLVSSEERTHHGVKNIPSECALMQAVCGGGEGAVHSAPKHSGSHAAGRLALTLRQVGTCPHLTMSVFLIF